MALKMLILRSKKDKLEKDLANLRAKDEEFQTREAELEAAIAELDENSSEEDRNAVEEQVEALTSEKEEHEEAKGNLEKEIEKIEGEMEEEEARSAAAAKKPEKKDERGNNIMETRKKFFGMNMQERDAFFAREDVKTFLQRMRDLREQKRTVKGAELAIPTVILDLIKENIIEYSKLYKHVNVRPVPGKARQTIMGTIPEGIWTEMCGKLNELELSFNAAEVDGYKVGGFVAVCNAILEDTDIALATEIIAALGKAIGLALDKAIIYGTGTKMPMGIVTRLAQTEQPADYDENAREWENLSESNLIVVTGKTDLALFKALIEGTGKAKGKFSSGKKFWAMSETTKTTLLANALGVNVAGALVAGMNSEMPVIGGKIEELSFIPDGVIVGGFGDLYLLAEREGASVAQSEHVRFIEDQTVFKGTARYDGVPVIAEGFVAIGISGAKPAANAVTFAADKANNAEA